MKRIFIYSILMMTGFIFSCSPGSNNDKDQRAQMKKELKTLTSLLQDSAFTAAIAVHQDSVYLASQNLPIITLPAADSVVQKSFRDQKIATNIAGFLALECGIGALMDREGGSPLSWLNKIVAKQLNAGQVTLLNRFANATWKASQPFRGMQRIKKDNFIVANFLSEEETKKDFDQVTAAANKLLDTLKTLKDTSIESQHQMIANLMKNQQHLATVAAHMEAAYYIALNQEVPAFTTAIEDTMQVTKSLLEEKVVMNAAAFYALECGLSYLASSENKLPSNVLDAILDNTISQTDKNLLERFANATWKAGQAFRDFSRVKKDNFTPFNLLSKQEVEKDWVQIKSAAAMLKENLPAN